MESMESYGEYGEYGEYGYNPPLLSFFITTILIYYLISIKIIK